MSIEPQTIAVESAGADWWIPVKIPIQVDRNNFFDMRPMIAPVDRSITLPVAAGPAPAPGIHLSDHFIQKQYGLRASAIPFAGNYWVGCVDQDGAREHCPHHHTNEDTAQACAEHSLRLRTKKLRRLELQKRGIPPKHIPVQKRKFKPLHP